MRGLLILMPLLLGCFDSRAQQPQRLDPIRAALEEQYAEMVSAYRHDAPEVILDLRTSDFEVHMPNGERWDAEQSAAYIRAGFQQVERTLELSFTIKDLDVRGDTAAARIHQQWARSQRMQGQLRRVETSACQRETWVRTAEGWRLRLIDSIQPLVWKVDGNRVDPGKPFDPEAPSYSPDVETKSPCTEETRAAYDANGEPPRDAHSRRTVSPRIDPVELAALMDSVFQAGMEREKIPGAAFVVVQDGRIVLAKGYGHADVTSGRVVQPNMTIFPIASVTKVFTATAVMQLADAGRIDLDADVNRYLTTVNVPPTYPKPVTVAHLLSHTAGFDELPGRRVDTAAELVPLDRFLAGRLIRVHRPGQMTSYSSYGMALAGLLIEDVSGLSFEEYLRRNIWDPLGMSRTSISLPDSLEDDLATAYELEDDNLSSVSHELYQTPPTSSIVSTVEDMARFMIAHLQNGRYGETRILSDSAAARMHRQHATLHPRVPGWALGFQVDDSNGRRIIEHGGDIGGFSSLMTLLPDEGVGIFAVHHLEGSNLRFDVKRALLDRYFPDHRPLSIPTPHAGATERLRRFAGTYRASIFCHTCPGGGPNVQDFEVLANEDGTISVWNKSWVEISPLYFVSADGRSRIGFAEDESGRVIALTGGSWRVLERIE